MTQGIVIQERGWAGHFICADSCRYRRNTLLSSGDRHIVVSSVGSYRSSANKNRIMEIGDQRYYETMIFRACQHDPYIEADVGVELKPAPDVPCGIFAENIDGVPQNADNIMDSQHDAHAWWVAEHFDEVYRTGEKGEHDE